MGDDGVVLRDERQTYDDGTVARVRVLAVPESDRFPDGVKYAFHYGNRHKPVPIVRYDNHHGRHEVHRDDHVEPIEFPGIQSLYRQWRSELPSDKQADW